MVTGFKILSLSLLYCLVANLISIEWFMSILLVAIWMPFAFAVVLHRLTESKSMTIDSPKTMESRIDILSLLPLGVLVTSGIPQNLASVAIEGSKMAHHYPKWLDCCIGGIHEPQHALTHGPDMHDSLATQDTSTYHPCHTRLRIFQLGLNSGHQAPWIVACVLIRKSPLLEQWRVSRCRDAMRLQSASWIGVSSSLRSKEPRATQRHKFIES